MSIWTRIDKFCFPGLIFAMACAAAWLHEPWQTGLAFICGLLLQLGISFTVDASAEQTE